MAERNIPVPPTHKHAYLKLKWFLLSASTCKLKAGEQSLDFGGRDSVPGKSIICISRKREDLAHVVHQSMIQWVKKLSVLRGYTDNSVKLDIPCQLVPKLRISGPFPPAPILLHSLKRYW
jgi:hypothetical protein